MFNFDERGARCDSHHTPGGWADSVSIPLDVAAFDAGTIDALLWQHLEDERA